MNKRKSLFLFVSLVVLMFSFACATVDKTSYKTLYVSQTTYDTTMTMLGDLYKQGKITEKQKQKIIDKAKKYKEAHNLAVNAFLKYKESGLTTDEENYLIMISKASVLLAEFINLAKPYIEK